jgi:tetratricopeptide (TPR) repeat protein
MQVFSAKDVERVLGISKGALRALVRGGFVAPARGRHRQYVFSFRDLATLRAARALLRVRVPPNRITGALARFRSENGPSNVRACGTELVVRDECGLWRNAEGQFLLQLEATAGGTEALNEAAAPALEILNGTSQSRAANEASCDEPTTKAEALFDRALRLEEKDAEAAISGYKLCVEMDPSHGDARLNWGRLLHSSGALAEAEAVYRGGLGNGAEDDPSLLFNLALVLEDTGRELEAIDCYKRALARDSEQADVHLNLARLYQQLDMARAAIRHWNEFRRISGPELPQP